MFIECHDFLSQFFHFFQVATAILRIFYRNFLAAWVIKHILTFSTKWDDSDNKHFTAITQENLHQLELQLRTGMFYLSHAIADSN